MARRSNPDDGVIAFVNFIGYLTLAWSAWRPVRQEIAAVESGLNRLTEQAARVQESLRAAAGRPTPAGEQRVVAAERTLRQALNAGADALEGVEQALREHEAFRRREQAAPQLEAQRAADRAPAEATRQAREVCVACMDRPCEVRMLPCQHRSLCMQCVQRMQRDAVTRHAPFSCPLCRIVVDCTIRDCLSSHESFEALT